jgi:transcription elongation factor B subunit 1
MLSTKTFEEGQTGRVHLDELSGILLERVCDYLYFNLKYKDVTDVPEFDIPPEMALELLVAADYLDGMISMLRVGFVAEF